MSGEWADPDWAEGITWYIPSSFQNIGYPWTSIKDEPLIALILDILVTVKSLAVKPIPWVPDTNQIPLAAKTRIPNLRVNNLYIAPQPGIDITPPSDGSMENKSWLVGSLFW